MIEQDASNLIHKLSAMREELRERYSVNSIGIFGSFARGDAEQNSDVDVLVELAEPTFDHYIDLKFELERIFQRSVDLVMAETLKPRLKPFVEKEVIYA